jgi:hypothetical protein
MTNLGDQIKELDQQIAGEVAARNKLGELEAQRIELRRQQEARDAAAAEKARLERQPVILAQWGGMTDDIAGQLVQLEQDAQALAEKAQAIAAAMRSAAQFQKTYRGIYSLTTPIAIDMPAIEISKHLGNFLMGRPLAARIEQQR